MIKVVAINFFLLEISIFRGNILKQILTFRSILSSYCIVPFIGARNSVQQPRENPKRRDTALEGPK